MELDKLLRYVRGDEPADLLLKNARVVNVLSGEILETNVAIVPSRIVGVGEYDAREVLDLDGAYMAPGLIDAHVHVESSLMPPQEFARTVVPRGTTTVVSDPHEIANVLGLEGIRYMAESAKAGPLSIFFMAPSCVPATHMETNGAVLRSYDLAPFLTDPYFLGLAEVMNFPGVIHGDAEALAKIDVFADRVLDGHCPGLTGKDLAAYVAAGISSDHESTTVEEAREKLRLGMTVFMREATNARNLEALLPLVTTENHHRICFCTDDRQPADLLDEGHIDFMLRRAIAFGIDPVIALRMATWNAASHFRMRDRGAVAPGWRADLIVFDDLLDLRPKRVYRGGVLVARDGEMVVPRPAVHAPPLRSTMNVDWSEVDLSVPAESGAIRVIGVVPDQLFTESLLLAPTTQQGLAVADPERDLLKIVVIERHRHTGGVGRGFVRGIGLTRGALASSIAHDHHNLVVVGADDVSMLAAAKRASALGGGMVVASGDDILAELPLPVAGLMVDQPAAAIRDRLDAVLAAARELGANLHDPFMAMSFLALEVIPSLKITDLGLVDVDRFAQVPLWAPDQNA